MLVGEPYTRREVYKVTGQSELCDTSHVLVWESREQDAQQGALTPLMGPLPPQMAIEQVEAQQAKPMDTDPGPVELLEMEQQMLHTRARRRLRWARLEQGRPRC